MRRVTLRLVIALLTFAVGVVAAALWLSLRYPQVAKPDVQIHLVEVAPAPAFVQVGGMSVLTDKGCINSETYRAADGSQVSFSLWSHRSPAQATRELRRELKGVERIIEQTLVKDESGKRVGERMLVLWQPNARGRARVSVLWTRGHESYSINGESLEQTLKFEQYHEQR